MLLPNHQEQEVRGRSGGATYAKWLHKDSLTMDTTLDLTAGKIVRKQRQLGAASLCSALYPSYLWQLNTDLFLRARPGLKKSQQSILTSYNAIDIDIDRGG